MALEPLVDGPCVGTYDDLPADVVPDADFTTEETVEVPDTKKTSASKKGAA